MVKRKTAVAVIDSTDSSSDASANSDLESELLSLSKKKRTKVRDDTDSDISSDSDSPDERATAVGKKRSKPVKSDKKLKSDSELEEGEVSDDESDSSDLSQEEFNDGYGSDLMGDEEDRARLARMTEKEREQEIFKRIEAREVSKTRFNIEKKLRRAKRREMKKQQKSSSHDKKATSEQPLDLKERVLERKKTVEENRGKSDKKFQAMNLLKARREEKREREREEKEKQQKMDREKGRDDGDEDDDDDDEERRHRRQHSEEKESTKDGKVVSSRANKTKLKASDVYSDDSGSSSESGDGGGDGDGGSSSDEKVTGTVASKGKKKVRRVSSGSSAASSTADSDSDAKVRRGGSGGRSTQYITTREQLNQIKLSRHKLERFVHLPIFKRIAVGCFVRIMIGQNNGRPVYRVCEVMDVVETAKIYQLGNTRTNKGLRLRHGAQERVFRLEFASNQEFSDSEFTRWRETCALQGISTPTVEEWESKIRDIKEAISYEFKEEDIEKIVKEKERFKKNPFNYAMKKTQLMKERDMAQSLGETVRASELQEELNLLEERATELDRMRTSTISSISYINDRNRKRNVEEAEKAILAELKATKGQRADDPFTRRHTKPSMVVIKSKKPEPELPKEAATAATATATSATSGLNNEKSDKENDTRAKKANPHSQKQGEDMYAAHDFDIKIDLDVAAPTVTAVPTPTTVEKAPRDGPPKRSLNIEDYKRRKGFI